MQITFNPQRRRGEHLETDRITDWHLGLILACCSHFLRSSIFTFASPSARSPRTPARRKIEGRLVGVAMFARKLEVVSCCRVL